MASDRDGISGCTRRQLSIASQVPSESRIDFPGSGWPVGGLPFFFCISCVTPIDVFIKHAYNNPTNNARDGARQMNSAELKQYHKAPEGSLPASPKSLYQQTLDLARAFGKEADLRDDAFLKLTDPRAIQGGALCEEADQLRGIRRQLRELACAVEDIIGT